MPRKICLSNSHPYSAVRDGWKRYPFSAFSHNLPNPYSAFSLFFNYHLMGNKEKLKNVFSSAEIKFFSKAKIVFFSTLNSVFKISNLTKKKDDYHLNRLFKGFQRFKKQNFVEICLYFLRFLLFLKLSTREN